MTPTFEERTAKAELIDKCAVYLNENFHKFSQTNKIKIALEIFKRNMPTQLEGQLDTGTKVVIIHPTKEDVGNTSQTEAVSSSVHRF